MTAGLKEYVKKGNYQKEYKMTYIKRIRLFAAIKGI
jgi:hypothetical protein